MLVYRNNFIHPAYQLDLLVSGACHRGGGALSGPDANEEGLRARIFLSELREMKITGAGV